jgi:hypothetical protein
MFFFEWYSKTINNTMNVYVDEVILEEMNKTYLPSISSNSAMPLNRSYS